MRGRYPLPVTVVKRRPLSSQIWKPVRTAVKMNKDELKAVYKEQLRAEPEVGSKGAGLGFMEIARRASKPIEFDFTDVDAHYAFFALKATI